VLRALRQRFLRSREPAPARRALVLAGGGVIGGMYEVGALAALDEALPEFRVNNFDLYVGSSSGSVVSALMANGIGARALYDILDKETDDPLNFQRGAVYHKGAFSNAARNLAQFVWAVGKKAVTGFRLEWPDLLARSGADMPPGFFSVAPLERFMREAFAAKGLPNSFRECRRPLLIPAILLDQGERAVFGLEPLLDVPTPRPSPPPRPFRDSSSRFASTGATTWTATSGIRATRTSRWSMGPRAWWC